MLYLQAQTRLTERPSLSRVSDEVWQTWGEVELARCSAVIVDQTGGTEGVAWELNRALDIVELPRIIVLQEKGQDSVVPGNVWVMEYELGDQREEAARGDLEEQLHRIFS